MPTLYRPAPTDRPSTPAPSNTFSPTRSRYRYVDKECDEDDIKAHYTSLIALLAAFIVAIIVAIIIMAIMSYFRAKCEMHCCRTTGGRCCPCIEPIVRPIIDCFGDCCDDCCECCMPPDSDDEDGEVDRAKRRASRRAPAPAHLEQPLPSNGDEAFD